MKYFTQIYFYDRGDHDGLIKIKKLKQITSLCTWCVHCVDVKTTSTARLCDIISKRK